MAAIDWVAEAPRWTGYLRDRGFQLTVGDDLRIAALADRLTKNGLRVLDAPTAARWFGPVICRNADDQNRLPELLAGWVGETPDPPPLPERVKAALRQDQRLEAAGPRPWSWWWLVALTLLLAGVATMLAPALFNPAPSVPVNEPISSPGPMRPVLDWVDFGDRLIASVIIFAPFALAVVIRRLWHREPSAMLRGLAPRDAPTASLEITLDQFGLFRPEALRAAVADLRRHRLVPADWIDAPRTVAATVAAAGHIELVWARRPTLPEHLLLVDLAGSEDILATLAELIVARLRGDDAIVQRFDYDGDPRRLRRVNDSGLVQRAVDLEALRGACPDHRLLILSDGVSFTEPGFERMRGWVNELHAWPEVALLTPVPAAQWGPRERALIRLGFIIVEATPNGIADLARQFRTDLPQERATPGRALAPPLDLRLAADPYLWLGERSPSKTQIAGLLGDLKGALGERAFLYLCALAVFPTMHPKLTLAVGRALADEQGQPLLNEQSLAQLCRVPWLRRGRMPDWLRLALVRDLEMRPEEAERVRATWAHLLEPQEEGARNKLPIKVVRQAAPGLAALVAGLLRRRGPYREAILVMFLNRMELPALAVELPERLASLLREDARSRPDWVLLGCGAVLGALLGLFLNTSTHATNVVAHWLLGRQVIAALQTWLPIAALALGSAAMTAWYARDVTSLAKLKGSPPEPDIIPAPVTWQEDVANSAKDVAWRTKSALGVALGCVRGWLPPVLALSCFLASLSIGLFAPLDARLLTPVLLSGQLVVWSFEPPGQGAVRWMPFLVLLNSSVAGWRGDWLLLPLVAWLASRHDWFEMRRLLVFASPGMVLGLPLAAGWSLMSEGGFLLVLWWLARFVADEFYRARCLHASGLGGRELAVLFLPLAVELSIGAPSSVNFGWHPFVAFEVVWLLIGLSGMRPRAPLILAAALAPPMLLWHWWFGDAALALFGVVRPPSLPLEFKPVEASHELMWPSTIITAVVMFICGRQLWILAGGKHRWVPDFAGVTRGQPYLVEKHGINFDQRTPKVIIAVLLVASCALLPFRGFGNLSDNFLDFTAPMTAAALTGFVLSGNIAVLGLIVALMMLCVWWIYPAFGPHVLIPRVFYTEDWTLLQNVLINGLAVTLCGALGHQACRRVRSSGMSEPATGGTEIRAAI
jgi:hypothetical protein